MQHERGKLEDAGDADADGAPGAKDASRAAGDDAEAKPPAGAAPDYDDAVDEASEESFPASDPPSFNP